MDRKSVRATCLRLTGNFSPERRGGDATTSECDAATSNFDVAFFPKPGKSSAFFKAWSKTHNTVVGINTTIKVS